MKYLLPISILLLLLSCKDKSKENGLGEKEIEFPQLKSIEDLDTENVSILRIGENDRINFNSERIDFTDLCKLLKLEFLKKRGVILTNDKKTRYKFYQEVYDKIKKCYLDTLNEISDEKYGRSFESIDSTLKIGLQKEFPLRITETKPG